MVIPDDGILDVMDKCPNFSSPDNHDHDGDGIGDPCDLCPHMANATLPQPDGDLDGVGDACDPRPGMTDERLFFNGFYSQTDIDKFSKFGAWSFGAGGFAHTASLNTGARLETPTTYVGDVALTASISTMQVGDIQSDNYVGIFARSAATGLDIHACHLRRFDPPMGGQNQVAYRTRSGGTLQEVVIAYPGAITGVHTFAFVLKDTVGVCGVDTTNNARSGVASLSGKIGVEVSFAVIDVDFIFAVEMK